MGTLHFAVGSHPTRALSLGKNYEWRRLAGKSLDAQELRKEVEIIVAARDSREPYDTATLDGIVADLLSLGCPWQIITDQSNREGLSDYILVAGTLKYDDYEGSHLADHVFGWWRIDD